MRVEQIAVFLENKSGRLAEITRILADNDINIRALSVADTFAGSLDPQQFPPGTQLIEKFSFGEACQCLNLQADDFVLIATNSQDKEALDYCIDKPTRYLGLLASRRKILVFTQALRDRGVSDEDMRRLSAPVGLDLGAETPEEIFSIIEKIKDMASTEDLKNLTMATSKLVSNMKSIYTQVPNTVVITDGGGILKKLFGDL